MKFRFPRISTNWIWTAAIVVAAVVGGLTFPQWWPSANGMINQTVAHFRGAGGGPESHDGEPEEDPHAGHDHAAHAGHDEATSLELSDQALRNVGLTPDQIRPITLETFRKAITVPAVVAERPGRTRVQVATPMTGVITYVHAVQGEAVDPGTLLFRIRLTHEDLVQAQTDFLKNLGELDIEHREIARLQEVTRSGAIAGKVLLNREYARDKLMSTLKAQREGLRLHGLSGGQVDRITSERRLLRELQIFAPSADGDADANEELRLSRGSTRAVAYHQTVSRRTAARRESDVAPKGPLILQELNVHKGQSVAAGETLCFLADFSDLFIEGLAFEQDIHQLRKTSDQGWTIDAIFEQAGTASGTIEGLEIAYLSNRIETESRTLRFYVGLPNEITKDRRADGDRFVEWKYLPGQRLQLRVPVEEWRDQIVLPVDAVANEGAEYFVFQQNGGHFDRLPVHVKYRDQHSVVIENDGSLFPGDVVARRGAHQLQMALKNKSGGGVDPHAGHNH